MQRPRRLRQQTRGVANLRKQVDMAHRRFQGPLRDRLYARLVATEPPITHDRLGRPIVGPCLLWQGYRDEAGYGRIRPGDGRNAKLVHRVSLALARDVDMDSLDKVDHLCRVRNCAQPTHLEETGQAENVKRGDTGAHWRAKTHCPQGHPYDEANTYRSPPKPGFPNGRRVCRTCTREAGRRYDERNPWRAKRPWGTDR
jgi:hypothetical protein